MTINLQETYKARRAIIATRDAGGREVVHVHLARGQVATLDRNAFDRLMRLGVSPNWFLNVAGSGKLYVRASVPVALGWGNNVTVARLIAAPEGKEVVRYRDGDCLNLRHSNLYTEVFVTRASGWEIALPARAARLRSQAAAEAMTGAAA